MLNNLLDSQTLQQLLNTVPTPDLVICDCRFNLTDPAAGLAAYQTGHIPGAYYLHLDADLSSPIYSDSGRHPLPDITQLSQTLRACGVNQSSLVVAYDAAGGAVAARLWWLLRWLGHTQVAVLDGGFPAWQAAQLPTSQTIPAPKTGDFVAQIDSKQLISVATLSQTHAYQLVDARAAERFRGENEPLDPVAGHIPNAINRPQSTNLQDGLFKPAAQLRQEWLDLLAGRSPSTIAHYCGSGVTACHNQLAMEIAGLTGSRLYAGSWSEWIRDPQRPIAIGVE